MNKHSIESETPSSVDSADSLERQLAQDALTPIIGYSKLQLDKKRKIGLVMPDSARCNALLYAMRRESFKQLDCMSLAQSLSDDQLNQFVDKIDTLIVGDITPQHSMAEMGGMDDLASWQDRADKPQQHAQIKVLLEAATKAQKQRVFVALRAPYVVEQFKDLLDTAVVTYDYRVSIDEYGQANGVIYEVLSEWFAGKFDAEGQLPVTVNITEVGVE